MLFLMHHPGAGTAGTRGSTKRRMRRQPRTDLLVIGDDDDGDDQVFFIIFFLARIFENQETREPLPGARTAARPAAQPATGMLLACPSATAVFLRVRPAFH
mgnify:CR=1 FL=1